MTTDQLLASPDPDPGRFQPTIVPGLVVHEYHRDSRLEEYAVAYLERVFKAGED
jgi:hypothetical protein